MKLLRQGTATASVISEQPDGESIESLAACVGLNGDEFDQWASDIDETRSTAGERLIRKAEVPNTVVALWAGNCGALGRWWIDWQANIRRMESRGFRVVNIINEIYENQLYEELVDRQSRKALYGIYFWGHGYKPYPSRGLCSMKSLHLLRYDDLQQSMMYSLGFSYLFACDSNSGRHFLKSNEWIGFSGTLVPWWPWSRKWRVCE